MKSKRKNSRSTPDADMELGAAVARFRADGSAMAALRRLYDLADRAAGAAGLRCLGGGCCCKFDLADHRLYVTTAELAMLTAVPPPDASRAARRRCPYQVGPSCACYPRRPLGCRTFFCRGPERKHLERLHERLHRRIVRLHQTCCIPYAYGELGDMVVQSFPAKGVN